MKLKLFISIIFCSLCGTNAQNSLQTEMIIGKSITACKLTEKGAYVRYKKVIPTSEVLLPEINMVSQDAKKINYQIKGNISSKGLSANKVKTIRIEQEIIDGFLVLKHYVEIVGIAGKEGNDVLGYNYTKNEMLSLPKEVKNIKLELYHEYSKQRTPKPTTLAFQKEIIIAD